jgi:toxin ParE1/3/4
MSYRILIEPRAKLELNEACLYYASLNIENVVENFLNAFQEVLNILEKYPFFEIRMNSYRTIAIQNFPYILFFEVFEDERIVKIVSVFHTSQNPKKYPK